jgi:hypothetical protein
MQALISCDSSDYRSVNTNMFVVTTLTHTLHRRPQGQQRKRTFLCCSAYSCEMP